MSTYHLIYVGFTPAGVGGYLAVALPDDIRIVDKVNRLVIVPVTPVAECIEDTLENVFFVEGPHKSSKL